MAQKQQRRTMLLVPLDETRAQIRERIEKGRKLLELRMGNDAELQQAQYEKKKWTDFNAELSKRIVDTDELVNDYYPSVGFAFLSTRPLPLHARAHELHSDIKKYITRLESILGRLELIPSRQRLANRRKNSWWRKRTHL